MSVAANAIHAGAVAERRADAASRTPRARLFAGIMLSALACVLLVIFFRDAGALWRDEANSAGLAEAAGSLRWTDLQYDSFPAGWIALVAAWTRIAGTAAASYRLLGFLVGIAVIAAMWLVAFAAGHRVPLVTLLLAGISGASVRTFSSLRGYGVGIVAALAVIAAARALAERGGVRLQIASFAAALIAVHLLYQNAVIVLAAFVAAAVVLVGNRRMIDAVTLLGGGGLVAASMLVYVPIARASRGWIDVLRADYDFGWFWIRTKEAVAIGGTLGSLVWIAAIAAAAIVAVSLVRRRAAGSDHPRGERWTRDTTSIVFGALLILVVVPGYYLFLQALTLLTAWWYYVPMLVVAAAGIDMILGARVVERADAALAFATIVAAAILFVPAQRFVRIPASNIDLAAGDIARTATASDLIVVSPWPVGVSYGRVHGAAAPWQTAPPLAEHRWHAWSEAAALVHDIHAMDPIVAAVHERFARGATVYVVTQSGCPRSVSPPPTFRGTLRQSSGYWGRVLQFALADDGRTVCREGAPAAAAMPSENVRVQIWSPRPAPGR